MWTSEDVAGLLNGVLLGTPGASASGCALDSRLVQAGQMFFALPGEKADGHAFIQSAWKKGAGTVIGLASRLEAAEVVIPPGKALVLVDSVTEALNRLAKAWRRELGAKVVGITGSNGKTTTKDMVAAVLGQRYQVHKSKGNHNNELGLPLTILSAPPDTEVLVLEMGMRGLGEIRALCAIGEPDIGVITNIGTTHLELLKSQENIAKAKWELIEALPSNGIAILNGEDEWSVHKGITDSHPRRFYGIQGKYATSEIHAVNLETDGTLGTKFSVVWGSEQVEVRLPLPGEHNVLDALAALAVGTVLGVSLAEGAEGLLKLRLSKMRLEVLPGVAGSTLISDVYNANPVSMQASLRVFNERSGENPTLAILGEMYELGDATESGHRAVGQVVAELGIGHLISVGALAEGIAQGAREAGYPEEKISVCINRAEAITQAKAWLAAQGFSDQGEPTGRSAGRSAVNKGTWVLIKGSRGMKMEEITQALQTYPEEKGR